MQKEAQSEFGVTSTARTIPTRQSAKKRIANDIADYEKPTTVVWVSNAAKREEEKEKTKSRVQEKCEEVLAYP